MGRPHFLRFTLRGFLASYGSSGGRGGGWRGWEGGGDGDGVDGSISTSSMLLQDLTIPENTRLSHPALR